MNITGWINRITNIGRYLLTALMLISFVSVSFGADTANLSKALSDLCVLAQSFLGIASMLLIVLAGAIYAIGQILGAETRARATVWATAMLTGAVIGIIIYILAPIILSVLLTGSGPNANPCTAPPKVA